VPAPEIAVVMVAAAGEAHNVTALRAEVSSVLDSLHLDGELIVVDQKPEGYGAALLEGFRRAAGVPFVVTMNADLSHSPAVIRDLWAARARADLVLASRYVPGGAMRTSASRRVLSGILNRVFSRALSVPVRDLSSGYRLYHRHILDSLAVTNTDFAILPEILVRLYAEGYRVVEVPFVFAARDTGQTRARLASLGWSYLKTLGQLWRLRNSIGSADYDHRAFDSAIWLQRYWQRARHAIVLDFTPRGGRILDVGCGSSRILRDLPGAVGVDVLLRKLRFMRPAHPEVVRASVFALPFEDASFDTVICSEVIEHIPDEPPVLGELTRVLRPGGTLVLGTPDYGRVLWHIIEWVYGRVAPGGYADEHITHFDREMLAARLVSLGYEPLDCRYVGACEMIFKARKAL
jgi:dolichol-phosphate mannosyltransferase